MISAEVLLALIYTALGLCSSARFRLGAKIGAVGLLLVACLDATLH